MECYGGRGLAEKRRLAGSRVLFSGRLAPLDIVERHPSTKTPNVLQALLQRFVRGVHGTCSGRSSLKEACSWRISSLPRYQI